MWLHKRCMGHIAHLVRNTADNTKTLIFKRENIIISFWELNGPLFLKTRVPIIQGCFLPSLVEIGPVVLEKIFFKILFMYFLLFGYYSPLQRGTTWIIIPFTLYQRLLCAKFGWKWPSGSWKKIKIWKVYKQMEGQQVIRKTHLNFKLRWAKRMKWICYWVWNSCAIINKSILLKKNQSSGNIPQNDILWKVMKLFMSVVKIGEKSKVIHEYQV